MNYIELIVLVCFSTVGLAVLYFMQRKNVLPVPEKGGEFIQFLLSFKFQVSTLLVGLIIGTCLGFDSPILTTHQITLFGIAGLMLLLVATLLRTAVKVLGWFASFISLPLFLGFFFSGIAFGLLIPSILRPFLG